MPENSQKALSRKAIRRIVDAKKDKACENCSERFPACAMSFDHMDPKTKRGNISAMAYKGKWNQEKLIKEIKKCRVLCLNCHSIIEVMRRENNA